MPRKKSLWEQDSIQFPRLICEILATQDKLDLTALRESMNLETSELTELFDRAHAAHEACKAKNIPF